MPANDHGHPSLIPDWCTPRRGLPVMRHRSRQLHRADVENKILSRGGLAEDALTMASYSPRQGDVPVPARHISTHESQMICTCSSRLTIFPCNFPCNAHASPGGIFCMASRTVDQWQASSIAACITIRSLWHAGDSLGHDRNPLGMDSTQIGVLEQMDQVGLRRLLHTDMASTLSIAWWQEARCAWAMAVP